MRLRRRFGFHEQLLLSFIGLLTFAMVGAGVAVTLSSNQQITAAMADRLQVGSRVLDSRLQSQARQLAASVRVLTRDFAFVTAVATEDTATIGSVLRNHGNRVEADLVALATLDGELISASSRDEVLDAFPFVDQLAEAREHGETAAMASWNDDVYELFILPVKAPNPIAWVTMAFRLDDGFARELAALTGTQLSFVNLTRSGAPRVALSTLPADQRSEALRGLRDRPTDPLATWSNTSGSHLGLARALFAAPDGAGLAVLQVPMAEIAAARQTLVTQLGTVLGGTLCVFWLVSLWLAKRMSSPVAALIGAARRIRAGNYGEQVQVESGGELQLLGDAMNTMAEGIAEREEAIRRQAFIEPVTGLPNKTAFAEQYRPLLAADNCEPFSLVLLRLANWRDVNFSLGFETSDLLQQATARRLRHSLDDGAEIYAFSAYEFAVVMPRLTPQEARTRALGLLRALNDKYDLDGVQVSARCTAAVIGWPTDTRDFDTLVRGVENTLEHARNSENDCLLYLPEQEEARERQLRLIGDFDDAFRQDQFSLVYQPKVAIDGGPVTECEALLRWQHPQLGFIPPDEFILLAERSGNIRRLTDWVLAAAIRQAASWRRSGFEVCVAVNLSARDLADASLPEQIEQLLEGEGAQGGWLALEITESAVLKDRQRAAELLVRLKRLGISLSIDDYGTGYSSLAQLKQLPVDELKIDKSFVLELDQSPDDALIVRSTIELGHNLGMRVVAEGVENEASLDILRSLRCDKVQGYLFSRPLKPDEFLQWCMTMNDSQLPGEARLA